MKKLMALLLAMTMVFSLTACDLFNRNPGETTAAPEVTGEPNEGDDDKDPVVLPESEDFDFGVIAFKEGEFNITGGLDAKIGGNLGPMEGGEGFGASDSIRIAGFQGYPSNDGFPDDPESKFTTLLSQNGPFWENISKIEASFYITALEEHFLPEYVGNIETFYQLGRDGGWDFKQLGGNLINQTYDPEDEDDGFEFGNIMTATWDFDKFKEEHGTVLGEYVFDQPPTEEGEGNWGSGSLSKFGVSIKNEDIDEYKGKIFWTDVKIYVHDMDVFMDFVKEVEEETEGRNKMSDDLKDRVIEA